MEKSIVNLKKIVEALPAESKKGFERIFSVSESTGRLKIPAPMRDWVASRFGSVEAVEKQKVIEVANLVTGEGTLFNELRAKRPKEAGKLDVEKIIAESEKTCAFCSPEEKTPEDAFGRVKGKHCITASNVAKFDALHGLVIFNEHDPFVFDLEKVADYIDTAMLWFKRANQLDKKAVWPFFMWNCLWRSGASIIHGHAQVTLSEQPYAKVAQLKKMTEEYKTKYGSDYWEDFFAAHEAVGLIVKKNGVKVAAHLTPLKEKEIFALASAIDNDLKETVAKILDFYYKQGVRSFNLAVILPPLDTQGSQKGWEDWPIIIRAVDRGSLEEKTCDIGAMELCTASVVAADPFKVAAELRKYF